MQLRDKVKVNVYGSKEPVDGIVKGLKVVDQGDGTEKTVISVEYLTPVQNDFDEKDVIVPGNTGVPTQK